MEQVCSVSIPVKEVLIEDRVVVGEGLRQSGEASGGDLLESGLEHVNKIK